jgi:hypothetical protein
MLFSYFKLPWINYQDKMPAAPNTAKKVFKRKLERFKKRKEPKKQKNVEDDEANEKQIHNDEMDQKQEIAETNEMDTDEKVK